MAPSSTTAAGRARLRVADRLAPAPLAAGYPAEDLAGYVAGEPFDVALREHAVADTAFRVRDYQSEAAEAFHPASGPRASALTGRRPTVG